MIEMHNIYPCIRANIFRRYFIGSFIRLNCPCIIHQRGSNGLQIKRDRNKLYNYKNSPRKGKSCRKMRPMSVACSLRMLQLKGPTPINFTPIPFHRVFYYKFKNPSCMYALLLIQNVHLSLSDFIFVKIINYLTYITYTYIPILKKTTTCIYKIQITFVRPTNHVLEKFNEILQKKIFRLETKIIYIQKRK